MKVHVVSLAREEKIIIISEQNGTLLSRQSEVLHPASGDEATWAYFLLLHGTYPLYGDG